MAVLARIAWADGTLQRKEADLFLETMTQFAFSPERQAEVYPLLLQPVAFSELPLGELSEDDRRWLIGFGCQMAASDGTIADEEVSELQVLARLSDTPFDVLYEEIARWTT